MWYTVDTAYWVAPLASGIHLHLRTPANATMGGLGGSAAPMSKYASGLDEREASMAPELMCATPGFLAISVCIPFSSSYISTWADRANRYSRVRRSCGGECAWCGQGTRRSTRSVSSLFSSQSVSRIAVHIVYDIHSPIRALVFMAVTIGRLEIMKSPPTRLAVMFFVEPDGIGTAVSVFVSDLIMFMLLGIRPRCVSIRRHGSPHLLMQLRPRGGSAWRTNPGWREHKGTKWTRIRTLGNIALWSFVVVTTLGTVWVSLAFLPTETTLAITHH